MKRRESILAALFLDLPFLVDSFWRKFEYDANRNHVYRVVGDSATMRPRALYRSATFGWLLLLIVFVCYGPTHAPLCAAGGNTLPRILYGALCISAVVAGWLFVVRFGRLLLERGRERLSSCQATALRRRTLWSALSLFLLAGTLAFAGAAYQFASIALDAELCDPTSFNWRSLALLMLAATAIGVALLLGRRTALAPFWVRDQPVLILAVIGITWFALAPAHAREADGLPYRQAYSVAAAAMFALTLFCGLFARSLFKEPAQRLQRDFTFALHHSELFVPRGDPDLSVHRVWHAIVNGAVYRPLLLFLMPALVAVVVPDSYLYGSCAAALLFSALLLAWGSISTRWQQMVLYVRRWFLTGTPFAVSVLVIVLAGARLAGNQYVATVLAAAPFGAIFMWIVMIYGLLWLFEHVVNQSLGAQLFSILSSENPAKQGFIPYSVQGLDSAKVASSDRYLAMHGAGRFAVVGRHKKPTGEVAVFHTYGYAELFAALAARGALVQDNLQGPGLAHRLDEGAREIERRSQLYFNMVNATLILLVAGLAIYSQYHDRHYSTEAVVKAEVQSNAQSLGFDLTAELLSRARTGRPALIVAASGGGSRAALYTVSALEGLARLGATQDIVLVSGVSGGGVALANFSAYRDRLPQGAAYDPVPWQAFKNGLSQPFIQDVIEGAMEWRLVGATPLSALLVESFERRLDEGAPRSLRAIKDLGLILNTSITGHPAQDSVLLSNAIQPPTDAANPAGCVPYSYLSGARLAFTNLRALSAFPRFRESKLPDVDLPYVLVNDPHVSIAAAAALNANFPPVFPNARVDLADPQFASCNGLRSYYVTDGGATENLGLISGLYALHSALANWPEDTALPDIHIVALEASASDFDYRQDRGVSTATGGSKERLAGGLTEALLSSLESKVAGLQTTSEGAGHLELHYLTMPLTLRSRGGVGTHWMLANDILVTNPHRVTPVGFIARTLAIGPDAADRVRITRDELFELLNAMHSPDASLCAPNRTFTDDAATVARWICGAEQGPMADLHVEEWRRLTAVFADRARPQLARGGLALTPPRE
jgi:hypothetical protein